MKKLAVLLASAIALCANAASAATSVNLNNYTLTGRYALPEPKTVKAPANSVLAQEASGITYNASTDTLFIVGDGGTSIVQVSKTGQLIDSMTLALGNSAQGTAFYDPEGIAWIGGNQFVFVEERDRIANLVTYVPNTTIDRTGAQSVKLGTTIGNIGLEGMTFDPVSKSYIFVKESGPEGIFETTLNFAAGTASNGSASTVNSVNLFDPAKLGLLDFADVFALSNVSSTNTNLLVLSQESGKLVETDRLGNIVSTLDLSLFPGTNTPNSIADKQFEGVTMDKNGVLYITTENGGGSIDFPQLFVFTPNTVAAVPEPATWAMMTGGMLVVGGALRRRKKAGAAFA